MNWIDDEKTVTISLKDYVDLLIDSEMLARLEAGGVDNWEWYSESLNEGGSLREWKHELRKEHGVT